jgi:hypothetical protein
MTSNILQLQAQDSLIRSHPLDTFVSMTLHMKDTSIISDNAQDLIEYVFTSDG